MFLCCFLVFYTKQVNLLLSYFHFALQKPEPTYFMSMWVWRRVQDNLFFLFGYLFATISPFSAALEFAFSLHLPWLGLYPSTGQPCKCFMRPSAATLGANQEHLLFPCLSQDWQCPPPAGFRHSFHPEGFWALHICITTQSSVQGWVSFQKNDWALKCVSGNSARPLKKYLPKGTLYVKSKGLLAIMSSLVMFFFPKVLVPPFLLSVNTKEKANSNSSPGKNACFLTERI